MFKNTKPLSATPIAANDDGNEFNKYTKTRLLHTRGNPIFSWIKNSCNNNNNNNEDKPNSKPNIILSSDQINNKQNNNNNKENNNSSQPELRGVQNLRHLWNSRITKAAKALTPAKSYGCLLQEEKPPPPDITRALSVHNIIESLENSSSSNRSAKDNFYKYKTAATFEKNRCQSASPAATPIHALSSLRLSFNNNSQIIGSTKGGVDKTQWMRRDDIMVPKKEESPLFPQETNDDDDKTNMNTIKTPHMMEATPATPQVPSSSLLQAVIDDDACDNKSGEHNHSISETQDTEEGSHCSLNSLRSLETTSTLTTTPTTTTTTVSRRKNVNSTRKYSFKTQVKSYHSPRKMPYYNGTNASNKVAKLTQQFNEIIQKDKKILDEVKRNNGILISRGGHVYKVIDNSDAMTIEPSSVPTTTVLPNSHDKEITSSPPVKNIVQRAIKTFESKTSEKPKLPLKSAQVLRKKKELVSRKEIKNELKSVVLEEIQEETKNSDDKGFQPGAKRLENDFSLRVNNVVELLEGNRIRTKTEIKLNTNNGASMKNSKLVKNSLDSKFHFEGIFDKEPCNSEDTADSREQQPKILENLNETDSKLTEDTSRIETELIEDCQDTSDSVSEVQKDSSEVLPEEMILNALEEVNHKIESLCSRQFDLGHNDPEEPVNVNAEETVLNEAINTSLVDQIQLANDVEEEVKKNEEVVIKDDQQSESKIQVQHKTDEESIYEFIATETKTITGFSSSTPIQPQKSFLFCNKRKILQAQEEKKSDSSENYESINGSSDSKPFSDYGYEICETPAEAPAPPRPRKESTESQRNTTDKLPELPNPKRIIPKKLFTTVLTTNDLSSRTSDSGSINDEDSIYDTIKSSPHCYESVKSAREKDYKCADTVSLTSNGYESINNYRRRSILGNAESSSTISSDHKTNSLYEVSMVNGLLAGGGGSHNYSHSYITSSENSDDWVDISDSEVNAYDQMGKQQFIVVRERTKCHRSPDWSKRVRDKRLHQTISDDDDVDHYYEPLFPVGNPSFPKINGNTRSPVIPKSEHSDDYDSFETDDDIYEDNESMKKDDSGVDICNVKLPDPPPTKRQIYNFMKKFKNLIIKKSPSDPNKSLADSVQAKIYENTQNQMEGNEYQTTLKPTRRAPDKPNINKDNTPKDDNNIYENTDFHNSNLITSQSSPENGLKQSTSDRSLTAPNEIPYRSKSKTGMSFKNRLKSLGAASSDSKNNLSTMSIARSTFYVSETSEQDSGIFEKVSSSDVNVPKVQVEQTDQPPVVVIRKNKRQTSATNSTRRQTSIGLRPNDPPPPPPISDGKTSKQRPSTTSWYAECGVFKIQNNISVEDVNSEKQQQNLNKSTSNTSWYAEAGLYQTSGVSVASSSGSSGVSTGNEGGTGEDVGHHMFLNEPLYQIYSAEKLESISRDMEDHESTDGYEEIGGRNSKNEKPKRTRPTALQLVGPKSGPSRTLWSEIPEVISSEILSTLTPRERSLQEAKFEIITSEASYLKSLNLLRSHFMNHHTFHDTTILSSRDRRALFSYITPVHECSERLLSELEACWQDNIMLLGLSKSIYSCAEKDFQVYVAYCEHQGKMDRCLRRLKEAKGLFCQKLEQLESDSVCCGLTLHSFLMLPMQRITRLPLLIDAVFSKVQPNDDEYDNWKLTLAILNKIVAQCNEAANRCEQAYEIERISKQLEFPSHVRALAIAPAGVAVTGAKPRFLVKKGELVHLVWRGDDAKLTFGKKFAKSNIYAFLFSDLMVLTKRKGEEQFTVFDYCPRNMLTISSGDSIPQLPTKDANQTGKNLILMTLLENYERKTVEFILSCPSVSEMERWLQATRPPEAETPGEKLYEQWDCPQVTATHEFIATEPDLLSLEVGDVVNVSRKLPDGWFYGERIRDGITGWFPGSFTEEVNSAHVRARNLKQRYRLLTFTATYLEMQKRK
ncbi:putative mediator of RNA polymerase II transcription subunit 26 [Episyrphus balteatus]|uniref:putative mediator of RNA polymerase II transcription subunit 26 n=1 Tax=Episyrphus balteatus TaxID=286459 RepID=UPI002485E758|nr:putative mediator of RNA polymerase II transcription subunit 26 [Episyrphus balteatus]XP_055846738.1 putative mediator of RNA polymerase II transcription subunit 26 [Episyrphus balteatus]